MELPDEVVRSINQLIMDKIVEQFKNWKNTVNSEWDHVEIRKKNKCIGKGKSALVYEIDATTVVKIYKKPWSKICVFSLQDHDGKDYGVFWNRDEILDFVEESKDITKSKCRVVSWDYRKKSETRIEANEMLTEHYVHRLLSSDEILEKFVVPWNDFGKDMHGRYLFFMGRAHSVLAKKTPKMDAEEIIAIFCILCFAFEHAQRAYGLRHQDLHVENVFLVRAPEENYESSYEVDGVPFRLCWTASEKCLDLEYGPWSWSHTGLKYWPILSDFGFASVSKPIEVSRMDIALHSDCDDDSADRIDSSIDDLKKSWGPYSDTIEPNMHGYDLQVLAASIVSDLKMFMRSKKTIRKVEQLLQNALGPCCTFKDMSDHDRPPTTAHVSPVRPLQVFCGIATSFDAL